jgi:hypothetical protein
MAAICQLLKEIIRHLYHTFLRPKFSVPNVQKRALNFTRRVPYYDPLSIVRGSEVTLRLGTLCAT